MHWSSKLGIGKVLFFTNWYYMQTTSSVNKYNKQWTNDFLKERDKYTCACHNLFWKKNSCTSCRVAELEPSARFHENFKKIGRLIHSVLNKTKNEANIIYEGLYQVMSAHLSKNNNSTCWQHVQFCF